MKRTKLFLLILVLCLVILAGAAAVAATWYNDAVYNAPIGGGEELTTIKVTAGQTLLEIAPSLQEQGILKSTDALRLYLRLNTGVSTNLLKGNYQLPGNLNIPSLLSRLAEGPKVYSVQLTIPEGLRDDEVVEIIHLAFAENEIELDKQELLDIVQNPDGVAFKDSTKEFLSQFKPAGKPLEGFLFPDTYILGVDVSEVQIIEFLLNTMEAKLTEAGITADSTGRLGSFYEVLTLASIVEREANLHPDRKQVADIFLRRLAEGWPLGSDVCLLYYFKDWRRELTQADLDDASNPYNMRLLGGLTPTPIANPGISGIESVLEPTPNNYYYFIAGRDGHTYFATTLEGHYQNINNHM